jgi:glycosyltransferase involved in cell wall biosynthesis
MSYLSIIVPVYNKLAYIDSCIESILEQTYTDFELILVNDGSTDGSGDRCDHFKNLDKRIKVIHQENKGVSAARNAGLEISSGEFTGFIDGDDLIEKDMYATLIKNALDTDSEISICSIKKIFRGVSRHGGNDENIKVLNRDEGFSLLLSGSVDMSVNNKIFRSEIIKSRNLKFEGWYKEDFLFNILAFSIARKSVFQDTSKYIYILRESSISAGKFSEKDREGLMVDKKILSFVSNEMKSHLEEARVNFFIQNLYTLNLILLSSKKEFPSEYMLVKANLKEHSFLVFRPGQLGIKHRIAYMMYRTSRLLYTSFLRFYILIVPSEVGLRDL